MDQEALFEKLAPEGRTTELRRYHPGPTLEDLCSKYGFAPEAVLKLSSNENPLGPPPEAVHRVDSLLPQLHRYPDWEAKKLRQAIAQRLGLSPANVIIGAGSSELMGMIIRAFSEVSDEVASLNPSFTLYREITAAEGRSPLIVDLDDKFQLDTNALRDTLTERTKIIFLARPNNPTSLLIPLEQVRDIMTMAPEAVIVSDEAYIEFADNFREETALNLVEPGANLIVTRTFSKAFGLANLRIGYAVGCQSAVERLFTMKPKWNVGMVAQEAAIAALHDEAHLDRTRRTVLEGREYLLRQLSSLNGLKPVREPQANFVMVKVSDIGLSAPEFADRLVQKGIIIRGDFLRDYVRISIGRDAENEKLIMEIKRII